MSVIAGLQDFRQEAPPADIGVYLFPGTTVVFKHTFAGSIYVCAVRGGERGWILVDYGIDAATVINSALSLANRVFVAAGSYTINTSILIQGMNNIVLEGEGWHSTKLVAGGADVVVIKIGDRTNASLASTNIIVRGFYIDGSSQTTETSPPENNDRRFGIELASPNTETKNVLIENCYIYNTGSESIYGYQVGFFVVQNCIIEGTRGFWASIHAHGAGSYGHIINNRIINSAVGGIRHGFLIAYNLLENVGLSGGADGRECGIVAGGYHSKVIGNTVICNFAGSVAGIQTYGVEDIIIGNNIQAAGGNNYAIKVLDDNAIVIGNKGRYDSCDAGILIQNVEGAIIVGNVFDRVTREGITLSGARRCIVVNNVLRRISKNDNNTYDAIIIKSYNTTASTRNIIQGNQIWSDLTNLPRYGINEADTNQDYNIIANNIVTNCATAAINKQGVNSILDNNITA
jgi:hypothetical protein